MQLLSRREALAALVVMLVASLRLGEAFAGGFRRSWPQNVVRELQKRLKELGFEPGPIDGLYGPKTEKAIRAYQKSHGLVQTGRISTRLLNSLDIN